MSFLPCHRPSTWTVFIRECLSRRVSLSRRVTSTWTLHALLLRQSLPFYLDTPPEGISYAAV